jgi:hypothetical protein
MKLRYWHSIEGYIAHQVLWYVWNGLLWSLGNSGAIAIVGGRLKVAQLDFASGNTPQLVQLNALPQIVPELLYSAATLKSLSGNVGEMCFTFPKPSCTLRLTQPNACRGSLTPSTV